MFPFKFGSEQELINTIRKQQEQIIFYQDICNNLLQDLKVMNDNLINLTEAIDDLVSHEVFCRL